MQGSICAMRSRDAVEIQECLDTLLHQLAQRSLESILRGLTVRRHLPWRFWRVQTAYLGGAGMPALAQAALTNA